MDFCDIGTAVLAYRILGDNGRTLVIDTALGSCSAEWWHIAEILSSKYRVLVYDRAGYGKSSLSTLDRTPRNIASELNVLLFNLGIEKDIVLIGHSQGGLNVIAYAIMYPDNVKGLILLDPATPFDNEFKEKLTEEEYKKSGVDKTISFKIANAIMSMGLGFCVKPLLKKSPPFFYYKFSSEAEKYLLQSLCKKNTYKTALAEYKSTHNNRDTEDIMKAIEKSSLQDIPIKLITHSSDIYTKELEYFGSLDSKTARKIEDLWQEIMKRYLVISNDTEHVTATNSGHFIHLTDIELLKSLVASSL